MQTVWPASRRGRSAGRKAAELTVIGGSSGRMTRCQTGASCSLQSMKVVFIRFASRKSRFSCGRLARLHPVLDVVVVDAEFGIDLLHLDREHEWRGGEDLLELTGGGCEHGLRDQLAGLCRPAFGDPDRDVDEAVGGIVVGDAIVVAALGAGPQPRQFGD